MATLEADRKPRRRIVARPGTWIMWGVVAFFFINLGELSLFLLERYGLPEERFWAMAAEVIHGYQRRFPHEAERFTAFDLFSERIAIEQLTGRRLFAEAGTGVHMVRNPLAAFRTGAR